MVAAYSTQGAEIIISAPMRPDYPVGLAYLHEERRVLFVKLSPLKKVVPPLLEPISTERRGH
jgi:hypothetical protein